MVMVEVRGEIHVSAARAHWVRPDTRRIGVRFETKACLIVTTKRKFSSPAWNPAPVKQSVSSHFTDMTIPTRFVMYF